MAKIKFTEEQIEELRQNPYVESVTANIVCFTADFKRYFYSQTQAGINSRQIFMDCGIDPNILGEKRMEGFRRLLRRNIKLGKGFTDRAHKAPPEKNSEDKTLEARVCYLEHELAYARQEVEFLKKLQMADMEARRQWESKHQPK